MTHLTATLSDVTEVITKGTTPTSVGHSFADSGVPFLRAQNLVDGHVALNGDPLYVSEEVHDALARSKICSGDVLISIAGTIGRVSLVQDGLGEANCNQAVAIVRPVVGKVYPPYLQRWLSSVQAQRQITGAKVTGTISNLSLGQIAKLNISLPPLAEQKRIAAILDAADALRGKRRESLAQLDTLLQSTFLTLFGDPVTNPMGWEMGAIRDLLTSANYGSSKKASLDDGAYPMIRMNNISYSGEWDFSSLKYVDLDEKDLTKHLVHRGQILFNRTNSKELVGKTAVYRRGKPMAFAGYLVRGIVNETADPEYVGAYMNTPQLKQFLRNKCKSIVGMANINAKEFQAIPIPKPPLRLQRRFAAIVESVEQQKTRLRAHLGEMDALFASLQSRAFSGEL